MSDTAKRFHPTRVDFANLRPKHFLWSVEGKVATVTLNRPERKNPLTLESYSELRDAFRDKKPVQWVRIHTIAKHAHFPHMRHIKVLGPNACQTCHGDVARMPQVFKVNNVNNMGFCVSCHVERKVNRDCTACHY